MFRQWLFQTLRSSVQARLQEAAIREAHRRFATAAAPADDAPPPSCEIAVIFALGEEAGGLEDLLEGAVRSRGEDFQVRLGRLRGRDVAVVRSGAGVKAAARATESVLAAYRPQWVISSGFCGGLASEAARHDLLVAPQVLLEGEAAEPIELAIPPELQTLVAATRGARCGPLTTVPEIVVAPAAKRALGERTGALGADLETYAVVAMCAKHGVPCLAIRIVSDAVDERLPREVEYLTRQKSRAGQWGAALGAIVNRPGSLKDLYQLKENAILATVRLGQFLADVAGCLPRRSDPL